MRLLFRPFSLLARLIAGCAAFCDSCELTGAGFCDPGRCIEGTYPHSGRCYPCVENCKRCEIGASPLAFGEKNMTDQDLGKSFKSLSIEVEKAFLGLSLSRSRSPAIRMAANAASRFKAAGSGL